MLEPNIFANSLVSFKRYSILELEAWASTIFAPIDVADLNNCLEIIWAELSFGKLSKNSIILIEFWYVLSLYLILCFEFSFSILSIALPFINIFLILSFELWFLVLRFAF